MPLRIKYRHWPTTPKELALEEGLYVIQNVLPSIRTLSASLIAELETLKGKEMLSTLRGGRLTDLPRPLSAATARFVRGHCSALVETVRLLETQLDGSGFFLRTIKYDQARASTTAESPTLGISHFHFDAELSSPEEYPGTVPQFYLNLGQLPRFFRALPVPLPDVLRAVVEPGETVSRLEPRGALARYFTSTEVAIETVEIPAGAMAAFDGRRFAHDAGKGHWAGEEFVPSSEPDIVAALDLVEAAYHPPYHPESPFLYDTE